MGDALYTVIWLLNSLTVESWIMVIQRSHKAYFGLKFSEIGRILNYKSLTYHIDILVYVI